MLDPGRPVLYNFNFVIAFCVTIFPRVADTFLTRLVILVLSSELVCSSMTNATVFVEEDSQIGFITKIIHSLPCVKNC